MVTLTLLPFKFDSTSLTVSLLTRALEKSTRFALKSLTMTNAMVSEYKILLSISKRTNHSIAKGGGVIVVVVHLLLCVPRYTLLPLPPPLFFATPQFVAGKVALATWPYSPVPSSPSLLLLLPLFSPFSFFLPVLARPLRSCCSPWPLLCTAHTTLVCQGGRFIP